MAGTHEFQITTRLSTDAGTVWDHASSPEGIARELAPWMKMTFPAWARKLTPETVTPGKKLFRSWILLFGLLPVEFDDLTIMAIDPPRRFLERSRMLSLSLWQHERIVEPDNHGCTVTDRLAFTPKIPGTGPLARTLVKLLFTHRHRRLKGIFGG
ncbi:MAG: hypothetical protein KKA60_12000 [Proteobacteria bacterium]|nr:hypothetical protein [Pseudomonadota bacterium]